MEILRFAKGKFMGRFGHLAVLDLRCGAGRNREMPRALIRNHGWEVSA
jgi:hypothetical protein